MLAIGKNCFNLKGAHKDMSKTIGNKKCWNIFLVVLLMSCFANSTPSIDTNLPDYHHDSALQDYT